MPTLPLGLIIEWVVYRHVFLWFQSGVCEKHASHDLPEIHQYFKDINLLVEKHKSLELLSKSGSAGYFLFHQTGR